MAFLWKVPPGSLSVGDARAQKRHDRKTFEREEKQKVRRRDGRRCRWPRCEFRKDGLHVEVAHVRSKGMGGDHGRRSTAQQMLCMCWNHHQAPVPAHSMHSGDLRVVPLDEQLGTDGPCEFYDGEELVGREIRPGVLERV